MKRFTRNPTSESVMLSTRRKAGAPPVTCPMCSRPTSEPRGGLCSGCYQRAKRGHVPDRACAACGAGDRRTLRRHKLTEGMVTLCANDAAIAGRRPLTLEQLRAELAPASDRRGPTRRRQDRRGTTGERRERIVIAYLLEGDRREGGRRASERASDPSGQAP